MITVFGDDSRPSRGPSRRQFLQAGSLGVAGLTLGDVMRLRAAQPAATRTSQKSVIMLLLEGGPSHIDMFDLKPDGPVDQRGEFKPIQTNVNGIQISELLPKLAQITDKLTIARNCKFYGDHYGTELFSGFKRPFERETAKDLRPAFGSVVSKLRGFNGISPYVSLIPKTNQQTARDEDPVYLGNAHRPFSPVSGPGLESLGLANGMTLDRLAERRGLLGTLETLSSELDSKGELAGVDAYTSQALDLIASPKTREAFDINKESEKSRSKYGKLPFAQSLLQARRLVEAGVSVVTTTYPNWDSHAANFASNRRMQPPVDQAVHALVTDLHDRGLADDVLVVVWGEFGRTPKINKETGRDHWPTGFTLFAGGGLKMGQVIGATDSRAAEIKGRFYTPQNVLATIYEVLGIDMRISFPDHGGRPVHMLDDPRPIAELL